MVLKEKTSIRKKEQSTNEPNADANDKKSDATVIAATVDTDANDKKSDAAFEVGAWLYRNACIKAQNKVNEIEPSNVITLQNALRNAVQR